MDSVKQHILGILSNVTDPEIPVLTVTDLGIIRDIKIDGEEIEVIITPTYSGCPAMDMIAANIKMALLEHGYTKMRVTSVLSPAWTTDWMSEDGKRKLAEYGIAPPRQSGDSETPIRCPQCQSTDVKVLGEFGSTACKALYQCNNCKEPFDYFKCH